MQKKAYIEGGPFENIPKKDYLKTTGR